MLEELLTNPQVQYVLATIIAVILGYIFKKKIDRMLVKDLLLAIFVLIFEEEAENPANKQGANKKENVVKKINERFREDEKSKLTKVFGTIGKAVDWSFKVFGRKAIKSGLERVLRK